MKTINNKERVGVVLSSGGARGVYAHTGFMQALKQLDVKISAIAGCSAGALVGGIFASGADMQQWSNNISNIHSKNYWTPDSWFKFLWQMVIKKGRGYTGLSSTQAAIEYIQGQLKAKIFEDCKIPFHCLAMNISQGKKTLFGHGELAPRIMASAAIPILYQPVKIDSDYYSDGATIELAPTDAVCCKHNLDLLIVHHVATHLEGANSLDEVLTQPWSLLNILYRQLYNDRPWYLSNKPVSETYCQCDCGARVIVLQPTLAEFTWPFKNKGIELQKSSMENAVAALNEL
ncbi:hypothetical protein MNBD_GAMMA23-809 [hydrothermal vent metagenome]|uniref:PNPLA domain-containing protein n=1 Tax=hydrothermal vent metagenome TaxID=652676 RepID=A0A3B0ZMT0_9ZZZZ